VAGRFPGSCKPIGYLGVGVELRRRQQRVIVAWGGVCLGRICVSERVLPIRRIRGWVGAESIRPRATARGYPEPQLRSSIRMACSQRLRGLPTSTAASQLSLNPQHCKGERAFFVEIVRWATGRGFEPSGVVGIVVSYPRIRLSSWLPFRAAKPRQQVAVGRKPIGKRIVKARVA